MDPLAILKKYYDLKSKSYKVLISHSRSVTKKAVSVAKKVKHLHPDIQFIKEAAMLHDIGIGMVNIPEIKQKKKYPYICHGILGAKILRKEGFPKHARVCERHIGVGISKKEIIKNKLPLPKKDLIPITIEEKIICYADKFFTKKNSKGKQTIREIKKSLAPFGKDKVEKFEEWKRLFEN